MAETTNVATIDQLRATRQPVDTANLPAVRAGFFTLQGFELMQRVAKAFAASTLVPKEYQGNLPNCMIAINMAERIGADPMMVMQNLYIVHGRPGWSAQFLIATFNYCGRFTAIRYEWFGDKGKDGWGCRAYATEKESGEKIVGPDITIALSKAEGWYEKSGSKWKTIPQLMLMYRAAAWMIRSHAPEIAMGLQTAEELGDTFDAQRGDDGGYHVNSEDLRKAAGEIIDQTSGEINGNTETGTSATDTGTATTLTYAVVRQKLETANSDDEKVLARDLIRAVSDAGQRKELEELARLLYDEGGEK